MKYHSPVLRNAINLPICLIFSVFMSSTAGATELKYWVSEKYSAAPNVNFELGGNPTNDYTPSIAPLEHKTVNQSEANIFLCFDNRALYQTGAAHLKFHSNPIEGSISFCEVNDPKEGLGFISHPNILDKSGITQGVSVRKSSNNKIYCEAIFTVHSLFSFLGQLENIRSHDFSNLTQIEPYNTGQFLFADQETRAGFEEYLSKDDDFEISSTTGGNARFVRLSMTQTWSCLAPAFRLYWLNASRKCSQGIEYLRSNPDKFEIKYRILKENWKKMAEIASQCK